MSIARKAALKKVLTYEGSGDNRRELSQEEYEKQVKEQTQANFNKMKPQRLSHSLSTPNLCAEFIELANTQEQHKHLQIRYRKPTGKLNPKTKKPQMSWEVYTG
ncbi:hypothetical protein [Shewanella sp. MBTL60-007]|uniref:hypothetical protein n=1 Tax=Shewanella sp. MBTL60-007 TaxID=2815911 RepID=UPI00217FB5ED|nr:hypothetical protein [Shewanella sp. MBTL60-007]